MLPLILLIVVLVANALLGGVAFVAPQLVETISPSVRRGLRLVGYIAIVNLVAGIVFFYIYAHELHP